MAKLPIITKGPYLLDGKVAYRAICPKCQQEKILDNDQYCGRISIQCDCGYHETHDLSHFTHTAVDFNKYGSAKERTMEQEKYFTTRFENVKNRIEWLKANGQYYGQETARALCEEMDRLDERIRTLEVNDSN